MNHGDIILVKFPFTNLESTKKRPALVISKASYGISQSLYTIAMITSKLDGIKMEGDVLIKNWESAMLIHPSLLRLSKIATVESEIIDKKLGRMHEKDIQTVKKEIKNLWRWWLLK